ncbi:hypothetical protein EIP91_008998 [Steccherinum ochraceum]|uniref:Uncharacterized protein n=1 Tax=Steccherinum ochraceum TaxID=92696 RepID=A0A4R0R4W8_9APHY|nr:hypothetical protein EIP91_008998 [Steccherinum ochraceum]
MRPVLPSLTTTISLPISYFLFLTALLISIVKASPPVGTLHYREHFYVGAHYVSQPDASASADVPLLADGQIYVEHLTPASGASKEHPLLFVHGAGMTATNFLNTPDGRMGWADWFLGQGYEVYLVDQAARGRSPWLQQVDGPQTSFSTQTVESLFTAPERFALWPNASLHTQWPGVNGSVGDPIFDSFFASMVPLLSTDVESGMKNQDALVALLDRIGAVHLLTHSQAGLFGWSLADARPHLIKSLTALEPGGPPFSGDVLSPTVPSRSWGLTDIPLNYDPPLPNNSPDALNKDKIVTNDPARDGYTCYAQSPPARTLPSLKNIPIVVVTSETSWHGVSDGCIVEYLKGVGAERVQFVRLQDHGFHGNGHMFFMEKNSLEIVASVVGPWIADVDRERTARRERLVVAKVDDP